MTAAAQARLREALEARLGDAAAGALAGMPPEARLRSLANALGGDEDAALAFLADASGLEVLPEPAVDAEGVRALPARLAVRLQPEQHQRVQPLGPKILLSTALQRP